MRKSTIIKLVIATTVTIVGGVALAATMSAPQAKTTTAPPAKAASGLPIERIQFGGEPFDLEVAATEQAISKGLSKRTEIPKNTGMIFVFPSGNERFFWMIDCFVDIDIAYLSADGTVVSVYTMKKELPRQEGESNTTYEARLKRYNSGPGVQFAIETPAGTNEALKIKPGVRIPIDRRKLLGHLTENRTVPPPR
jgi:uncharacterized membrane protein (UPF0127 family)